MKWRIIIIVVFIALVFAIRNFGGYYFGNFVTKLFEKGTESEVNLVSPRLHVLPLGLSADGLSIVHPGEKGGVFAERVSVKLSYSQLLRRHVELRELVFLDAKIISKGENSGFSRLIRFILKKPPKKGTQARKKKWKVSLKDLAIHANKDIEESVALEFEKASVHFSKASFFLWKGEEEKTFLSQLLAESSRYTDPRGNFFPADKLNFVGLMGKGGIDFRPSSIESGEKTQVKFSGFVKLGDDGFYNLDLDGFLGADYIEQVKLAGKAPLPDISVEIAVEDGSLSSSLKNPALEGKFAGKFLEPWSFVNVESCSPRELNGIFSLKDKALKLKALASEEFLKQGGFDVSFEGSKPFSFDGKVDFDRKNDFYRQCALALDTLLKEKLRKVPEQGELLDADFELTGEFSKKLFKGRIEARTQSFSKQANNYLTLTVGGKGSAYEIYFSEKQGVSRNSSGSRVVHSKTGSIDARLRFDTSSKKFHLDKLAANAYPGNQLLARISPFMKEDTTRKVRTVLGEKSRLFAQLEKSPSSSDSFYSGLGGQVSFVDIFDGESGKHRAECDLDSGEAGLALSNCLIFVPGGKVSANGIVGKKGKLDFKFWSKDFDVSRLEFFKSPLPKSFSQKLSSEMTLVRGEAGELSVDAAGSLKVHSKNSLQEWFKTDYKLKAVNDKIDLEFSNESKTLVGKLNRKRKSSLSFDMELANFPLPTAPHRRSSNRKKPTSDSLSAKLAFSGDPRNSLNGEGALEVSELILGGRSVSSRSLPLKLTLKNGGVDFDDIRLASEGMDLNLDGKVNERKGWDAKLSGTFNLAEFLRVADNFEQVSGSVETDLKISGDLVRPKLQGTADLNSGIVSFLLGKSIVGADEINGRLNFDGQNMSFDNLRAKVGQGKLLGSGYVKNFFDSKTRESKMEFALDRVEFEPVERLSLRLAGKLNLDDEPALDPKISGNVEIEQAFYENDLDLFGILSKARDSIIGANVKKPGGGSRSGNVDLNVALNSDRKLVVETNIASVQMSADLNLLGNTAKPKLEGSIDMNRGNFGLQSDQFQIISGGFKFSKDEDIANPELNIVGETEVIAKTGENVPVRINITGTVTEPDVNFASDSGLSEEELVALIGVDSNSLTLIKRANREISLIDILNPNSGVGLGERLAGITGFSRVGIDSAFSDTTGELVPLVTAERKFSDKSNLYLESELLGEFNSKIFAEYPLDDRYSVSAGWRSKAVTEDFDDSSGSFGVDVIYKRRIPVFRLFSNGLKESSREAAD